LAPHSDDELEAEDDDDLRGDAAGLFGIDLGDGTVDSQPIEIDGDDDDGGVDASTDIMVPQPPLVRRFLLFGNTFMRSRRIKSELLPSVSTVIRGTLLDLLLALAI
jgi:hypothetical protein